MSISLYIALYYNLLLLLVVYIAIQPVRAETVRQPYINNQIFSLALLLIVYVHVTFRPTDYHYFGDTSAYAMAFQKKAFYGTVAIRDRDIGFEYLTYWLSQLVNLKGYWFVLCSLYILPVFFALKKRFKQQYAVALVLFVCSLSFWGYGVNGLRNGIATSLVIFSFLVPNNDIKRIPVWIIACLFHQSVMLPIGCFLLTRLSNNPKHYLYLWGTFFLLMLVARDSFSTLLTNIPWFEQDKRMSEYLNMSYKGMEQMFSNIGFRWDFIIYSLIPIIAGVKYIYTYCYEDKLFIRLFNTYIASNAFWLLTFLYRFMPELIYNGHVYIAMPPLFKVIPKKGEGQYLYDEKELEKYRKTHTGDFTLQRYKGLGEMDASQLWETTLDPENRVLKRVEIEDARLASEVTEMLMGSDVPPRRQFIYDHADEAEIDA